jgi:hypothetical protein
MTVIIKQLSKYQEICFTCPLTNGCVDDPGFVGNVSDCPKRQAENSAAMQVTVPGHALACRCNKCLLANRVMACWVEWDRTAMTIDAFCAKFDFYRGTIRKWIESGKVKAEQRFGIDTQRARLVWYILDIEKPPPNLNPKQRKKKQCKPNCQCRTCNAKRKYDNLLKNWDGEARPVTVFAEEYGFSDTTIYRWLKQGKLLGYEKERISNSDNRYFVSGIPEP